MSDRVVRRDIQGLRAVAVALVVAYHLWPGAVPGGFVGVDVFFVVSGFLITAHLLDRPPTSGRALAGFWARRIRRLLPASLLVIAATVAASRLVAPSTEWARTAHEAIASVFYVENWALARSATDYLATDVAPSPLQHFWSLGVEEQFYLVWPLLLGAAFWWAARAGRSAGRAVGWLVTAVVAASFVCSLMLTARDPAAAYFVTPTRMWELGAGGLLAVAGTRLHLSPLRAAILAWAGLAAIAVSAFVLSGADPFPGWRALVPVLGAVTFLAAASNTERSPLAVLGVRPVQWLGDVSYSVYLWHWPLVVLAPSALGRDLTGLDRVGVVALTLVLSALSYRHVEQRWRRPRPGSTLRRPYVAALAAMVVVAGGAVAQTTEVSIREDRAASQAVAIREKAGDCLGAGSLADPAGCADVTGRTVLPPDAAAKDRAPTFANACFETPPYRETPSCTYGTGERRIALVGNSHSAHWQPAFAGVDDATVTTFLASECTTVDGVLLTFDAAEKARGCRDWTERVFDRTKGSRFDLIVTSQRNVRAVVGHTGGDRLDTLEAAYRRYLQRWTDTGAKVLVLRDTPFPADDVGAIPSCLAENPDDPDACSGRPEDWIPPDPLARAAAQVEGASVADLNRYVCEPAICRAVNGRVITYVDGSHFTETYARTLGPFLAEAIDSALDR